MLRRTVPGWEPPFQPMPRPGQYPERTRWLWLVPLAAGFVAVLGWVLAHDPGPGLALSDRGWLHRNDSWRRLLRAVAEYTVVAILAALLATTGAAAPSRAPATPDARTQAATCPSVLQTRAWLTCLWHQASKTGKANQPSTTTAPATDR